MTAPRQKNWVPMVATSDGMPIFVTITPLRRPATIPPRMQPMKPSATLCVRVNTRSKIVMPKAMTDGNERSISPVMTTSVKGMAMSAKYGVVDMKAM